jgi:hypothetical protein
VAQEVLAALVALGGPAVLVVLVGREVLAVRRVLGQAVAEVAEVHGQKIKLRSPAVMVVMGTALLEAGLLQVVLVMLVMVLVEQVAGLGLLVLLAVLADMGQ